MSPSISPPNNNMHDASEGSQPAVQPIDRSTPSSASWDDANKRAKTLESDLDARLLSLSRLTSAAIRSGRSSTFHGDAEALSDRIETGLKELAALIDDMDGMMGAKSMASLPPQHSAAHLLQRHRDIHMEYVKELRKGKAHLSACLQPTTGANDYLLREADRISHASGIADHIIKYQTYCY